MYDKLVGFIDEPRTEHDEAFLRQAEFMKAFPKNHRASISDMRELFDSITIDDLLAIRENLCSVSVYFEGDMEFCLGEKDAEPTHYTLMDDSTVYELWHLKTNNKKKFF